MKNDSTSETFDLKHEIGSKRIYFPIRFIKVLPLQSWGPSFNFSIWHVRLTGIDDPLIVKPSIEWVNSVIRKDINDKIICFFLYSKFHIFYLYLQYRQREIIRLCMKHFRRFEQQEVVDTLQRVTGVPLEDPRLSVLYDLLVTKGDHLQAERYITNAVSSKFFKYKLK